MKDKTIEYIYHILLIPFYIIHISWMIFCTIIIFPAILVITLPYGESIQDAY